MQDIGNSERRCKTLATLKEDAGHSETMPRQTLQTLAYNRKNCSYDYIPGKPVLTGLWKQTLHAHD
jgi:hypothetical protein